MIIDKPYLLFLGDSVRDAAAKTGFGLRDWCPNDCIGQWSLPTGTVDLGLPALRPAEAVGAGAKSLVIAVAPIGGSIADSWIPSLIAALEAGLDIESLSPANAPDHWDVIEGQGSLFHPAYAGVTLGLLHGSQPDALVLCHDPSRLHIEGFPEFPLLDLDTAIRRYLEAARLTNPRAVFVGVSLNTSTLSAHRRAELIARIEHQLGLPCCDPLITGVAPIGDRLAPL